MNAQTCDHRLSVGHITSRHESQY